MLPVDYAPSAVLGRLQSLWKLYRELDLWVYVGSSYGCMWAPAMGVCGLALWVYVGSRYGCMWAPTMGVCGLQLWVNVCYITMTM